MGSNIHLQAQTLILHVRPASGTPSNLTYLYGKWGVDVNSNYQHSRAASSAISRFMQMSNKSQNELDIVVESLSEQEASFSSFLELTHQPSVARLAAEYDERLFDDPGLQSNQFHKIAESLGSEIERIALQRSDDEVIGYAPIM